VYAGEILQLESTFNYPLLAAAVLAAFLGAFLGNKLLKKITIQKLQLSIGALLLIFSVLLGAGII
jgi:uncharacterized membrane protein YfcA